MNIFKRLFKIGQSEANAAIDNMEDPIKMTEQGIRDLKLDLEKSLESLAQIKALSIRAKNDTEELISKANDYQEKAMLILKKGQKGALEISEADRLATEALIKKEATNKEIISAEAQSKQLNRSVLELEENIRGLKQNMQKWKSELKTLKARVKVSKANQSLNKQMAEIDNSSTVEMLERMKDKVHQEEALAEAYGEIANTSKSIDNELNDATDISKDTAEDNLAKLKEKLGITDKQP